MRSAKADTACCSFCHKAEDVVERLIQSDSGVDVRICEECLAVCNSILRDEDHPGQPAQADGSGHLRLCDSRMPDLLNTVEQWVIAEPQHRHSHVSLARAYRLALSIMGLDSA